MVSFPLALKKSSQEVSLPNLTLGMLSFSASIKVMPQPKQHMAVFERAVQSI